MPVHWYYNVRDIQKDFGKITDYQPPKVKHPSSIMSLSNTGGGGRGSQQGTIIGDVINHGKKQFWGVPNVHYHQGMQAGENTLNAIIARLLTRSIIKNQGQYTPDVFYSNYIPFMTTPGTHNDTYAETYHRMFFKNYIKGIPPAQCSEDDGHNIASMGGFVLLPMVNLVTATKYSSLTNTTIQKAQQETVKQMYTTHNSRTLQTYAELYSELLTKVLFGQELRSAIKDISNKLQINIPLLVEQMNKNNNKKDTDVIGSIYSPACYIEDSFPALLYLAYRYNDSIEDALIANTNVGGENCHRGAALGALMGLANGMDKIPSRWITGLAVSQDIVKEANEFSLLCGKQYEQSLENTNVGNAGKTVNKEL